MEKISAHEKMSGLKPGQFESIKTSIIKLNYQMWRVISSIMLVVYAGFLISALVVHRDVQVRHLYEIMLVLTVIENIVLVTIKDKKPRVLLALIYASAGLFLAYTYYTAMILYPNSLTVEFPIFLIIFSIIIIDSPFRMIPFCLIFTVAAIIQAYFFKDASIRVTDMVYIAIFAVLAIGCSVMMSMMKLKGIWHEKENERRLKAETKTSRRLGNALTRLSNDYKTILYLDFQSNKILDVFLNDERIGSDEYIRSTTPEKLGEGFVEKYVYEEDKLSVSEQIAKDYIITNLEHNEFHSVRYRVIENDIPVYYELKFCKAENEENDNVYIMAKRNIDVEVRLDMVFQANLDDARKNATRDQLTGVNNKAAYVGKCEEIMQMMSDSKDVQFAIVMCDVNFLKKTNDTLGHEAGDKLLKTACKLVCTIFKHSPVYRIGGDEFVAILMGDDYLHRDALCKEAQEVGFENSENVSFATGMGVYDPSKDDNVESVFRRADDNMYAHKLEMKAAR